MTAPVRRSGIVLALLFGVAGAGIAVWAAIAGFAQKGIEERLAREGVVAQGRVTHREHETRRTSGTRHENTIYTIEFQAASMTVRDVISVTGHRDSPSAGDVVEVRYDASDPNTFVVVGLNDAASSAAFLVGLISGLCALAIGVIFLVYTLRARSRAGSAV